MGDRPPVRVLIFNQPPRLTQPGHPFWVSKVNTGDNRVVNIQGGPKMAPFLYALTLPNSNRFSTLFHCQNQEKICNNTITKDPTTPQVCRYTIL